MADVIVYSIAGSPFGRAVMVALEEKRAPYRLSPVAPGTFAQEPHIKRHPFGKVPAIAHGDVALYETQPILRYIDRVFAAPALTPTDPKAAAQMDLALAVNDNYLFNGVSNVIAFQRIVGPLLMGLTPDEAVIAAVIPRAQQVFAEIARLLGDQPFFAGDALTLADVHIGPQLAMLADTPEWALLSAPHPHLVAWLVRMNARESMKATTWERVSAMSKHQ